MSIYFDEDNAKVAPSNESWSLGAKTDFMENASAAFKAFRKTEVSTSEYINEGEEIGNAIMTAFTFVGDMIKWDLPVGHTFAADLNGTIWELTTLPPASTTWNIMGGHQGCKLQKIAHYTICGDYTKIDVTETTNYYEKFLNFVNKFCKDCNISILT